MAHYSEELTFSDLQIDVLQRFNISAIRASGNFETAAAISLVGFGKFHYSDTITGLALPLSFFDTLFLFDGSVFADTEIPTSFEAKSALLDFGILTY
jgi:hypothetical protein